MINNDPRNNAGSGIVARLKKMISDNAEDYELSLKRLAMQEAMDSKSINEAFQVINEKPLTQKPWKTICLQKLQLALRDEKVKQELARLLRLGIIDKDQELEITRAFFKASELSTTLDDIFSEWENGMIPIVLRENSEYFARLNKLLSNASLLLSD